MLRVVLSYGYCGLSFACASLWASVNGAARMSKAAFLRRFRQSQPFLEGVLSTMLSKCLPGPTVVGMRVRLVDATRVPYPGDKGRCWRVHAVYEPFEGCLTQLAITDHKGGEHLGRVVLEPNDLIIGDRAYGGRRGVAHVVAAGAHFIVRSTWHHMPLESREGGDFDLFEALRGLPEDGSGDFECRVKADERSGIPATNCRLIAVRKDDEAAAASKKQILAEAKKKDRKVDPRTLEACQYFFVLTSVEAKDLDADKILTLYRLRWQIEIEFKRLKSLMHLEDVRGKTPETIGATIAAKLVGAACVEAMMAGAPDDTDTWRLTQVLVDSLRIAILGPDAAASMLAAPLGEAHRPIRDKRRREPQCHATRALLA